MARTALVIKTARAQEKAARVRALGKTPKFATRLYHRCSNCGRSYGYMGKFDLCRICIREKANAGELMGVRKSSW
jgi:small subunit ribosomal protein S14